MDLGKTKQASFSDALGHMKDRVGWTKLVNRGSTASSLHSTMIFYNDNLDAPSVSPEKETKCRGGNPRPQDILFYFD
jgi:hypothetical protein